MLAAVLSMFLALQGIAPAVIAEVPQSVDAAELPPGDKPARQWEPSIWRDAHEAGDHPNHIAIVIDDFGNGLRGTAEMLDLDIPLTVAVMPFLSTTEQDAREAHKRGYDVLVHLPMEPNQGKASWLGPGAITTDLSDEEIRRRVEEAIAAVPHAIGVNNHMGSKATSDKRVMHIVMEVCREKGLFFLDSRTSYRSKAEEEAQAMQVPLLRNNIFLDEIYTVDHIRKQINRVIKRAEQEHITIVIGHVGPPGRITAAMLKHSLEDLQAAGELVRISDLLPLDTYPTTRHK